MIHELRADAAARDLRLDVWLEQQLEGCSRSLVARQIKAGRCTMSAGKVKASWRLRGDEQITIEVPDIEDSAVLPEDMALDILHEDEDLLVLNKSPGTVVHPAVGHQHGTLLNGLLGYAAGAWPPLLVHRLDADTSGLLLVAKKQSAQAMLQQAFKERQIRKIYLACCHGSPRADYFEAHGWIGRHPKDFRKRAVFPAEHPKAKVARSDFRVRQRHEHHCVLEVRIHSGRTHQIRVHLQDTGHPVLADGVYGRSDHFGNVRRQALHAWQLRFPHPSGTDMQLTCPIPDDLAGLLHLPLEPLDAAHG